MEIDCGFTKTIQVFINRCLRNITGIKWTVKISNKKLWKMTKQEPVMQTITTRKWRWIGHTLRKKNTNVIRHALEWNPQGNRNLLIRTRQRRSERPGEN